MFPDSNVPKSLSTSWQKAYVLQDGLGPLLSDWLATKLKKFELEFHGNIWWDYYLPKQKADGYSSKILGCRWKSSGCNIFDFYSFC